MCTWKLTWAHIHACTHLMYLQVHMLSFPPVHTQLCHHNSSITIYPPPNPWFSSVFSPLIQFFKMSKSALTQLLTSRPRQPERFKSWILRHWLTETNVACFRCWHSRRLRWIKYGLALYNSRAATLSVTLEKCRKISHIIFTNFMVYIYIERDNDKREKSEWFKRQKENYEFVLKASKVKGKQNAKSN